MGKNSTSSFTPVIWAVLSLYVSGRWSLCWFAKGKNVTGPTAPGFFEWAASNRLPSSSVWLTFNLVNGSLLYIACGCIWTISFMFILVLWNGRWFLCSWKTHVICVPPKQYQTTWCCVWQWSISVLFVDDHPGGCGYSRVTGSGGVPPQPCHETVWHEQLFIYLF